MTYTTLVESPADPFELPDLDDGCSQLLEQVARQACRLMGADGAAVCMLDADDPRRMRVVSSRGAGDGLLGQVMASDIGLTGRVLRLAQPVVASESECFPLVGEENPAGSHAVASCPIFLRDRLWGAVTVVATGALNHSREAVLEDLGDLTALASAAVQSAADAGARERALHAGVGALGTLLDLRDGYTSDHTDAVVRLCYGIGLGLALDLPPCHVPHGGAAARPRQDRRARPHPAQARPPDRRRVGGDASPPGMGSKRAVRDPGLRRHRTGGASPSRALGRRGLPRRPRRTSDPGRGTDHRRLRRISSDDVQPSLSTEPPRVRGRPARPRGRGQPVRFRRRRRFHRVPREPVGGRPGPRGPAGRRPGSARR